MKKHYEEHWEDLHAKIIGLGEKSARKSYYPELQQKLLELDLANKKLKKEIEERKSAEEALRESEERFRILAEEAFEGIVIHDKGKILLANDRYYELFGYTADELAGKDAISLTATPDSVQRIKASLAEGNLEPYEVTGRKKDGTKFPVEIRGKMLKYQGQTARIAAIRDISDQKRSEEALRESEKKYRMVLETSLDAIAVYDMEGKVTYFNPSFTRIFGWTLEERLGRKIDLFVPDDAWPDTRKMIKKVLAGENFSGFETRRYTKTGDIIHVNMSAAIYKDKNGNPIGSVINLRDITEQKKLETQLLQSQKMESLGTLSGGIAHDFNNLLMGIQGRISLMLVDGDTSYDHYDHLKGIEEYVASAADLTKQLLAFARGGKYEVKPTDMNELVNKSAEMFGRTKKEITIFNKNQEGLWTVDVDRSQIEQVMLNLYVNAWQSMPGGGELYLETENVLLDDRSVKPYELKPGKHVRISVTDTGVGMDKATVSRVFDPFFTTKEMGRGTGLGLASAYGIIKNHGGIINVYSEKGKGAIFNIYLPASEKEIVKKKELSEDILKGAETILLVDDEEIIIEVGRALIKKLGYKVLVANRGKAAIKLYEVNKDEIDMVILDMIMPDMGGGETYDMLKEINPDIKVLLSSGYSIDGQAAEIIQRGCNGFIQKPFNMMHLSQKIRNVLDK